MLTLVATVRKSIAESITNITNDRSTNHMHEQDNPDTYPKAVYEGLARAFDSRPGKIPTRITELGQLLRNRTDPTVIYFHCDAGVCPAHLSSMLIPPFYPPLYRAIC